MRALTNRLTRLGAKVLAVAVVVAGALGASPAFASTFTPGTPSISGTTQIGATLTANTGTWTPSVGTTFDYQWYVDGIAVDGETSSTYTVATADAELDVTVDVTAHHVGYDDDTQTAPAVTIDPALSFTALPRPTIVGVPQVGTQLSVSIPTWSPSPTTFSYRWLRDGSTEVGTSSTYTPVSADRGSTLQVEITPILVGYTPVAKTSLSSAMVGYGSYVTKAAPTITGTTQVGSTLTAHTNGWSPAPSSFAYQWTRNGVDIDGESSSTYVLAPADLGKLIRVRVVSSLAGYTAETFTSNATATITSGAFTTTRPTISTTTGIAVGQSLTASVADWTPVASFTYQWKRDGVSISGATTANYSTTNDDRCTQLTVTVTGTATGYTTTSTTSNATDAVACGSFTGGSTPIIDNETSEYVVGTPLTVTYGYGTLSPIPTAVAFQWYRDGSAIPSGTSASYTPTSADLWKTLTVKVTATKSGYAKWEYTASGVSISEGTIGNLTVPTISGTLKVGRPLTASRGTWTATPDSYQYQWYRDGVPIENTSSSTYNTTIDDLGAKLSVGVTAIKAGYSDEVAYSVQTAAIAEGAFDTEPVPTISGTVAVGRTLTASTGTWAPTPTTFTYQWTRNGSAIDGATGSTYALVAADEATVIRVVVTAIRDWYPADAMTSAATVAVAKGTMTTATPTISGTVQYGRVLTASTGTWTPTPSFTYQWTRDGVNIASATNATYTVADADIAHVLAVKVTGTLAGYTTVTNTSANTIAAAGLTFVSPPSPSISGGTEAGLTLTANTGTWSESGVTFSYRWMRDGETISGETASTYITTSDDIDHAITVRVGASLVGYATLYQTSAPTAVITGKVLTKTPKPTITGTVQAGKRLVAVPGDWGPGPALIEFTYQWYRGKTLIVGATSRTYTLESEDYGQTMQVAVTGTRDLYRPVTIKSKATAKVATGQVSAATDAYITGAGVVGFPLTAEVGSDWVPSDVRFTYAWYRDDKAISGATSDVYTAVPADVDHKISVRITGKITGFAAATAISSKRLISLGTLETQPVPTISGTTTVGQSLVATAGDWSNSPTLTYQWNRTKDGVTTQIAGATSSLYVLVGADYGATISVSVTASKNGYVSASQTSASTSTIGIATFATTTVPSVAGILKVGQTLQVIKGTWAPNDGTYSYQWQEYIDSTWTDISLATSDTYTLDADNLGHKIRVIMTVTKLGYTTEVKTSTESVVVANGDYNPAPAPVITGTIAVGQTLSANTGTWGPQPVGFIYEWKRGVTVVGTSATYVPQTADIGSTLTVKVTTVDLAGYNAKSMTSLASAVVVSGTYSVQPDPTISGLSELQVNPLGVTLTVDPGAWTPVPSIFSYKWKRGATVLSETAAYQTQTADLGETLTLEVKTTLSGYAAVTKTVSISVPLGKIEMLAPPTISSEYLIGQTVSVNNTGTWSVPVVFSYQWYKGSTAITGETGSSYAIRSTDLGKNISVKITVTAEHYESKTFVIAVPRISKPAT